MNILVHLVVILSFIIKNPMKMPNNNSMAKIKSNTGKNGSTSSLLFSLVNIVKVSCISPCFFLHFYNKK